VPLSTTRPQGQRELDLQLVLHGHRPREAAERLDPQGGLLHARVAANAPRTRATLGVDVRDRRDAPATDGERPVQRPAHVVRTTAGRDLEPLRPELEARMVLRVQHLRARRLRVHLAPIVRRQALLAVAQRGGGQDDVDRDRRRLRISNARRRAPVGDLEVVVVREPGEEALLVHVDDDAAVGSRSRLPRLRSRDGRDHRGGDGEASHDVPPRLRPLDAGRGERPTTTNRPPSRPSVQAQDSW